MNRWFCRAALVALPCLMAVPAFGAALQCVPYARIVSGVQIRGDALTWWDQASAQYKRGHQPKKGAVLAFRPNGPMTLGHVAVVSRILDDRRVLIRHANWSTPGAIEEDVLAIDVSDDGDWSAVRVWHSPTGQMGARTNPTFGFIYPAKAKLHDFAPDAAPGETVRFARIDPKQWDAQRSVQTVQPLRFAQAKPSEIAAPKTKAPKLESEPLMIAYADTAPSQRTLSAIIADVKRETRLN